MSSSKESIGVMIDIETKKKFEKICQKNSVRVSEALRYFVEYVVTNGEYPFEIVRKVELKERYRK